MVLPPANTLSPQARLYKELTHFRTFALADPRDRLHLSPLLLEIARVGGRGSTDKERVKDVLEQAIGQMGSVYGPALRTLYGLTDASWGKTATERHELAYEVFCNAELALTLPPASHKPIVYHSFRTYREKQMLKDLVNQLLTIARRDIARRVRNPKLANGTAPSHTSDSK